MAKEKKPRELSPFEKKLNDWVSDFFVRVPFVQKMLFVHNLQIMLKAGLPLVSALKILAAQVENSKLKKVIGEIKSEVEAGKQLSEVLAHYPKIFPPIYVSMIAAGETAGQMEQSLAQVSNQMKKNHELTSRIRGALIYPAVILIAMTGIGIEMVIFVLPKIMVMFTEFNAELPLPTKILMGIMNITSRYGIYILIGTILLISFLVWLLRQPSVRRKVHYFNLFLPIIGPIIKKINLARFSLTLSSLLQSTIPIIEAVRITADVESNVVYRENLTVVAEGLKKGEALSEILLRFPRTFPPMTTQMIMIGEETGQVNDMLAELANYYGDEVDSTMRNFATIIEPIIILVMGLAVAGIAVSVIMPMYSLAQSF